MVLLNALIRKTKRVVKQHVSQDDIDEMKRGIRLHTKRAVRDFVDGATKVLNGDLKRTTSTSSARPYSVQNTIHDNGKISKSVRSESKNYQLEKDLERNSDYSFYTKVVGVTYPNRQAIIKNLHAGESVYLFREINNPFDANAIEVRYRIGQTDAFESIGHLNKDLAAKLAPKLDKGDMAAAIVSQVTGGGSYAYGLNIMIGMTNAVKPKSTSYRPYAYDEEEEEVWTDGDYANEWFGGDREACDDYFDDEYGRD